MDCFVARCGYTGEDGFEIFVPEKNAVKLWQVLMDQPEVMPSGLGARDTLRLEAGMPLYGHELNESIDPYQAGLSFACSLKDRTFIGSEALAKKSIDQGLLKRVGIVLTGRRAAREGSELRDQDNRVVGAVTSGSFSPTLDKPIAMAYLPSEVSQPGTVLDVDIRGTRVPATVTVLPFYKRQ